MDAFENLVALLLRREGYWTSTSVKVELNRDQKLAIGRHSSPRWEIDVVAYRGGTKELLAVECKSFLDSKGVTFRNGAFEPPERYKLFSEPETREVVLAALHDQLVGQQACAPDTTVKLCLVTGKLASVSDRDGLKAHFARNNWRLIDDAEIKLKLQETAGADYENDVALVVAKVLLRGSAPE